MNITDSVLTSIKKLLGIAEEYEHFDADLIMHINSVFSILTQLGVGPSKGFMIEDKNATWKDFISDESKYMLVKSILENCYNNDVSLKDAGKTLAGIRLISACFIIVQKENKGRN